MVFSLLVDAYKFEFERENIVDKGSVFEIEFLDNQIRVVSKETAVNQIDDLIKFVIQTTHSFLQTSYNR
jgi:hypothetical protein